MLIDGKYVVDLTLTPNETIIDFVNKTNNIELTLGEIALGNPSTIANEGYDTVLSLNGKVNTQYQGSVDIRYNRMTLASFSLLDNPDLAVNSLICTPQMVVDAFNAKYATSYEVNDFDFTQPIPTPDRAGSVYEVISASTNLLFKGTLEITLKASDAVPEITSPVFTGNVDYTTFCGASAYIGRQLIMVAGAVDGNSNSHDCHFIDFDRGVQTKINDAPVIFGCSMAANTTDVYLSSGWHGEGTLPGIYKFGFYPSYTWTRITSLPYGPTAPGMEEYGGLTAYAMLSMTEDGDALHYVGGSGTLGQLPILADHWKYNITQNTWTELEPLPAPVWRGGVVWVDGFMYVMGGSVSRNDLTQCLDTLYRYDPLTNSWRELTNMPIAVMGIGTHRIGRLILVYSGSMAGDTMQVYKGLQVYNIDTDTWTTFEDPLMVPRSFALSCVHDNELYIFGGDSTGAGVTDTFSHGCTKINITHPSFD